MSESFSNYVNGVSEFMEKAGQNVPDGEIRQLTPDDRILRATLIYEEAMELINKGLGVKIVHGAFNTKFQIDRDFDIVETIDGACDLFWVAIGGVSVACNVNLEPSLQEVYRSNMSKFIDGHRREDGKWVKGPSYSPANIEENLTPRVPF